MAPRASADLLEVVPPHSEQRLSSPARLRLVPQRERRKATRKTRNQYHYLDENAVRALVARLPVGKKEVDGKGARFKRLAGDALSYIRKFVSPETGGQDELVLGKWPDVPLSALHHLNDAVTAELAQGLSPKRERDRRQREKATADAKALLNDFRTTAAAWLKHCEEEWTPVNRKINADRLKNHVYPYIGKMRLTDIRLSDIRYVVKQMESNGIFETRDRVLGIVGRVFMYAVGEELIKQEQNPMLSVRALNLKSSSKKHYPCPEPREAAWILRAFNSYTQGYRSVAAAMRLLPYVFLRSSELRSLRWEWIDWKRCEVTIPQECMKKKRSHIVPLSRQAVAILKELQPHTGYDGRGYIFPGITDSNRPLSDGAICVAMRRMGIDGDTMVPHSFRILASTILNDSGEFDEQWVEVQLAHVKAGVAGIYNRARFLPQRKEMMQWYADRIDAIRAAHPGPVPVA